MNYSVCFKVHHAFIHFYLSLYSSVTSYLSVVRGGFDPIFRQKCRLIVQRLPHDNQLDFSQKISYTHNTGERENLTKYINVSQIIISCSPTTTEDYV